MSSGLFIFGIIVPSVCRFTSVRTGFFVGAILANVVITELVILVFCFFCLLVLGAEYESVLIVLFVVALIFPLIFYHHSWSFWLGFDYLVESLPKYKPYRTRTET